MELQETTNCFKVFNKSKILWFSSCNYKDPMVTKSSWRTGCQTNQATIGMVWQSQHNLFVSEPISIFAHKTHGTWFVFCEREGHWKETTSQSCSSLDQTIDILTKALSASHFHRLKGKLNMNPILHSRTKHIELNLYFVRESHWKKTTSSSCSFSGSNNRHTHKGFISFTLS